MIWQALPISFSQSIASALLLWAAFGSHGMTSLPWRGPSPKGSSSTLSVAKDTRTHAGMHIDSPEQRG